MAFRFAAQGSSQIQVLVLCCLPVDATMTSCTAFSAMV